MEENKAPLKADNLATKVDNRLGTDGNITQPSGDVIDTVNLLNPQTSSETTLVLDRAKGQQLNGQARQQASLETMQNPNSDTNPINDTADDVLNDIASIQALIESGDDIELPDTTAGGLVGNEGTGFVTLNRTGDETLARAGYDTIELENSLLPRDNPLSDTLLPTITESDENIGEEDQTLTGNVLDNDSDADDILTVQFFTVAGETYVSGQTASVEGGSLTLNSDGSYSFIPATNWNGTLPVISYTTNTNASDTLTITLTPVSDLSDDDESVTTNEDTALSGNVLTNAASTDGIPEVLNFTVAGTNFAAGTTANIEQGEITLNGDGSYTFIPGENFNGDVPVVTYTVSDGLNTDLSTLTIEVLPVSDLSDEDEVVSTNEDTTISGNILANAASTDGIPEVLNFTVAGSSFAAGTTAIIEQGEITLNSDGSYTFVPADNFNGNVPVVTYNVFDGINTDTSTLTIEVLPVSDLSDEDELVSTNEDTPISGNVLANGNSTDGIPQVIDFRVSDTDFVAGTAAILEQGVLTLNSDGSYTFVPADNFNGDVPLVTYTVFDGINTDTSTLTIEVIPVSDLSDDNESVSTREDTPVTGNILSNAASSDGTPEVTHFSVANSTFEVGTAARLEQGTLTISRDGSYTFVPGANFNGTVPLVTYTVFDGINSDNSTLAIRVTPVSDLRDGNESINTDESVNEVTGNVLTNAGSADGTPIVTGFSFLGTNYALGASETFDQGNFTLKANGDFIFKPNGNVEGNVTTVTYTVSDGVNSQTSTLTINVTPLLPDAKDDWNFVLLEASGDGTVVAESVRGNIIVEEGASSGDEADTPAAGDDVVYLTQVSFQGSAYTFDGDDNPIKISNDSDNDPDNDNWLLTVWSSGEYLFETKAGMEMPGELQTLVFDYVIKDKETEHFDTDTASLTIELWPTQSPSASDHELPDGDGQAVLTDTLSDGALINVYAGETHEPVSADSQLTSHLPENALELADVLIPQQGETLEQYLSAIVNVEKNVENDNPEQIVNLENNEETNVVELNVVELNVEHSNDDVVFGTWGGSESLSAAAPLEELNSPDVLSY